MSVAQKIRIQRQAVFAPLGPAKSSSTLPRLRGVVFDMDGTLCEPQTWMFGKMREALGITKSVDILDHIRSLPINEQLIANQAIEDVERTAMVQMVAQPGLSDLMTYLASRGVPKGICTRNFEAPVDHLLKTFLSGVDISPVVTRVFTPPKPHPAGILHIAKAWGVPVEDMACVLMVGDSIDDMIAGRRAGATTVLLRNTVNTELVGDSSTDCVIDRLDELISLLEDGTLVVGGR